MRVLLLSIVLLACCTIAVERVPFAAHADGASLETLLREARSAAGNGWMSHRTVTIAGRKSSKGLVGRWRAIVDLRTGQKNDSTDYDLYRLRTVWDGRTYWRSERSGGVHPINSPFAQRLHITDAWLDRRGYLEPAGAKFERLADRDENGRRLEGIAATPDGGEPVELWFDAESHQMVQAVQILATTTRTVRQSEFRRVNDAVVPFKSVIDEGVPQNAETIDVETVAFSETSSSAFVRPADPNDFSVAGGQTTVPIEVDGFVVVEAAVNGRPPMPFILDTGGRAIVTPEAAQTLGLTSLGNAQASGAGQGTLRAQFARLDRLEIGGLAIRGLSAAVVPLGYDTIERGAKTPFAGILGLELFERLVTRIDFKQRTLTFRSGPSRGHEGRVFPIFFEDDMPCLQARMDGVAGEVAIDTGFPEGLAVQSRWAEANAMTSRLRGLQIQASGAIGGSFKLWVGRVGFELGGMRTSRAIAYLAENEAGSLSSRTQAGLAGNANFLRSAIEFDYRNGVMWLEGPADLPAPTFDRSGLSVSKDEARAFVVGAVVPGSPAADAGLQAGDQIIAVDGHPAAQVSGFEFGRIMRRDVGSAVPLRLKRAEGEQSKVIKLRELLP